MLHTITNGVVIRSNIYSFTLHVVSPSFFKLIIFHHLKYYTINLYLFTHSYYSACSLIQVFTAKY
jgi:hypothetical protein